MSGATTEIVGGVANLIGDVVLLAGSILVPHAVLGFFLVKGAANLGALWSADLVTDVQAHEGKRFASRRNLR